MSTELGKAYEVLGVKPGVPVRELKAAHRDLAKVWHPDRFVHDPGLQQKAQEKLKEINAAYELLISGKAQQRRPEPPPTYATQPPVARRQSQHRRSHGSGLALLMFMTVFAVTITVLLQNSQNRAAPVEIATENTKEVSAPADENVSRSRQRQAVGSSNEATLDSTPGAPSNAPLATVTVVIDPRTGLLATPDCRESTRMTYPNGNQPHAYCNAPHPPRLSASSMRIEAEKDSLLKSVTKRVGF